MVHTNNNTAYYINPAYLTFVEDTGYGANFIQVSASSSCYIRVFVPGLIEYDADGNYRSWKITAHNNKFPDDSAFYIYVRLERKGSSALVVYSKILYNEDGSSVDGSVEASDTYYYIRIGEVSSTNGTSIREISYDTGRLESDQVKNEGTELNEMWELDRYSTPLLIKAKQFLYDFTVKGFVKLIGGLKFSKGEPGDEKSIIDVKRSTDTDDDVAISDETIPTTQYVNNQLEELDEKYLRKDQDDTAHGIITFENQIKSHDFAQGNLMGAGWSIYRDGNNNVVVETDRMIIRKDLSVSELIVNQETFQKGSAIYVKGGCTITRVEEADTYYRCYFDNKDGEEFSGFVVGDQARCQRYDKSYQNVIKYYWRLVVGVGDDYVDLSKTDADGTGLPTEGDDIAQLGNRTDKTRQSAVVISPDSGGSVVIWAGINSFDLSEKNMIGMGVDASTGEAYFYGYGNMYMGDRNQTSFMRFTKNNGVEICGSLAVGTKLGDGRDLKDAIDSATPEGYQEFVELVTKSIDNLWKEADGVVNSFFLDYDPTLDNYPAVDWTTDEQKVAHVGDTYTNIATGDSWRWELLDGSYQWKYIKDTATKKALAEASKAKDVADGKRRVFTTTPKYTDSYDVGDLWVNATYGQYSNDILKCNTAKAANVAFDIAHWSKASKYTDDSSVNALKVDVNALSGKVDKFGTDIEAVKQQTDREYTIWFFEYEPTLNNYPASDWATPELVAEHDQDMFYYREAGKAWRFEDGSWKLIKDQDVLRALEQIAALQTQVSDFEYLREAFGKAPQTIVTNGLVMTSFVGVQNSEGEVESFLNGSDFAKDETHGKLLLGGGIPSGTYPIEERAKAALTRLYEDGYLYTEYMKAKGAILEAIRVLSAVIEGDLTLGDTHKMTITPSDDGGYPAISWGDLMKIGLELLSGNVSAFLQLGDLYRKNTSIRPNKIEVADTPVSADNLNRNRVVVEGGVIYIYNKNYSSPMTIKVSDDGKMNISDGVSSLDLSFSGGKPIIYSSAWPSQSDVPSGGVFMDGSGYLKIKG